MTHRPLVFIAAPYLDPDPVARSWNVARACALGRVALHDQLVPLVPYAAAAMLWDQDALDGSSSAWATQAFTVAQRTTGRLWVLLPDGYSEDFQLQVLLGGWRRGRPGPVKANRSGKWEDYRQAFVGAGLGELHELLSKPPADTLVSTLQDALQGRR